MLPAYTRINSAWSDMALAQATSARVRAEAPLNGIDSVSTRSSYSACGYLAVPLLVLGSGN